MTPDSSEAGFDARFSKLMISQIGKRILTSDSPSQLESLSAQRNPSSIPCTFIVAIWPLDKKDNLDIVRRKVHRCFANVLCIVFWYTKTLFWPWQLNALRQGALHRHCDKRGGGAELVGRHRVGWENGRGVRLGQALRRPKLLILCRFLPVQHCRLISSQINLHCNTRKLEHAP